jgi:hypothetical protein
MTGISRRALLEGGVPLALTAGVGSAQDPSVRLFQLAAGAGEVRRFEDFGAKGDYDFTARTGTDDTRSIQAAIDWAWGNGRKPARAIVVESRSYLCGPITTHPYTTLIGTGRQTSNFVCLPGTRGAWWSDRGAGAQKLMLSGLAWYGNGERALSAVCRFGRDGIQFGSEGILQGLWMRDAPQAIGLDLSGNVGIVRDITLQSLATGIAVYGNGNHLEDIISMQSATGALFHGCFVRGLHIEAVDSGGLPLSLSGDCRISDVMFSLAAATRFDHLIEVDDSEYQEWSLRNVQLFARSATLSRSLLKVGSRAYGGTSLDRPFGLDLIPSLDLHAGRLALAGQRWQRFTVQLGRQGGQLVHAIDRSLGGEADGAEWLVRGSSAGWSATPTGPAMAKGARWRDGALVLDTGPLDEQSLALTATVTRNTTGRAATVEVGVDPARKQLAIHVWDHQTGEPWEHPPGNQDGVLRISVSGFGG